MITTVGIEPTISAPKTAQLPTAIIVVIIFIAKIIISSEPPKKKWKNFSLWTQKISKNLSERPKMTS